MIMSRRRPVQQGQKPDDQTPETAKRRPDRAEREAMRKERARDAGLAMKEYEAERRAVLANTERLRAHGWQIISCNGNYCLVWGHGREVLMLWKDGAWVQVFEVSRGCRLAG